MRYSQLVPKTRRDDPKDAPSPGTRLLIRGGFIDQLAGGIWIMAPLGLIVRRQIEQIVRQEMERAGAIELELTLLQPREYWDETGRWQKYLKAGIAFHLTDRKGADFILAPTAEETVTHFARRNLRSYRDLPANLWQMGPKFRDELRPRQGIIRGREFLMKDAYSFDATEAGMRQSYQKMEEAYERTFRRSGFHFIKVEADSGAIGGSGSAEFMAITEYGEDTLLYCPDCHYGGNQEKASVYYPPYPEQPFQPLEKIDTPEIKTVEQLENFVNLKSWQMVKTIVMSVDNHPVIVSMRGDLEISEVKLANLLGGSEVETAAHSVVEEVTGAPVGFAGPINLFGKTKIPYYFDESVKGLRNFLCGANQEDVHYIGVNTGRDFPAPERYHDLSKAFGGMRCSNCQTGILEMKRGIELGHIFQLQQSYSASMQATFIDENGEAVPYWMGCYGIGVSRMVQAAVEQSHDERGIIWPAAITPFQAVVIPVNRENHLVVAQEIYLRLRQEGFRVLLDDRNARIGEKLTDAELLGWPVQILLGRSWEQGNLLEVRWRDSKNYDRQIFQQKGENSLPTAEMSVDQAMNFLRTTFQQHLKGDTNEDR